MEIHKLVLLRHGQSTWNRENRFTGWVDVELSEQGRIEAAAAGELIKEQGLEFDVAYCSLLKRAIGTLWSVLEKSDQMWIPIVKDWRLNERHYGRLQGLNKAETAAKYGEDEVFAWRRSYATPPPEMDLDDPGHPKHDRRYSEVPPEMLPNAEALKQTKERFMPLWQGEILPKIKAGKKLIITAHGNSLRALIQHLDGVSEQEISQLNIPTGIPLVYELDQDGKALKHYYLGDPEAAAKAARAVANQAKT